MKPSEKQLEGLQKYLKSVLKYQESYEEMYDHILSAIEIMPDEASFEYAVNDIIKRDFGGHNNLDKVEQQIGASIGLNTKKQFENQLRGLFNLQTIGWFLITGIGFYYTVAIFGPPSWFLKSAVIGLASIPTLMSLYRLFKLGYSGGQSGLYAVDRGITNIAFFPLWVLYNIIVWFPIVFSWFPDIWNYEKAIVPTVFLLAATIYTVAFIRFYRFEFKSLSAIKNQL